MDFLDPLPPEGFDEMPPTGPKRVYGVVDSVEPEDDRSQGPVQLFFDCIDADWLDIDVGDASLGIHDGRRQELLGSCPSSVVSLQFDSRSEVHRDIPLREGRWVQMQFEDTPTLQPVDHYLNLFQGPQQRFLRSVSDVDTATKTRIDSLLSLEDLADSDADDILDELPTMSADYCMVVDVGQGNCNAVFHDDSVRLYFDMGGGVLGNRSTFPAALMEMCETQDPPIVLSHWDWDHWSSAQRFPGMKQRAWIVPRQPLGAVHRRFLAQLSRVFIWPRGVPSISSGSFTVEMCTGAGRNHSGLALIVANAADGQRMLFTGDARYTAIPSALIRPYTSVVVPHHGGSLRSSRIPARTSASHSRLAYSFGLGNTFGHPSARTRSMHMPHWGTGLDTASRLALGQPFAGLGNIGLHWSPNSQASRACRGVRQPGCSLEQCL